MENVSANTTTPSPVSDPRSTLNAVLQVSSLAIITVIAIVGNILILVAISRFTRLQTKTNAFVVNLAFADLLLATLAMPFTLASSITYEWVLGDILCSIQGVLNSLFCEASILTLTFVSLERCVAILYPLRYHALMTDNTVKGIIVYIWVQALLCATSTFLFSRFRFLRFESLCTVDWGYSPAYTLTFACIFLFIPFCTVCVVYCLILRKALDQQRKICALKLGKIEREEGVRQVWNKGDSKRKKISSSFKENHGSMKQEHKATLMIFMVVGTFCVCWIPHAIGAFCLLDPDCKWDDSFFTITTWLAMLNSAMNFLIYGLMNRTFRKAFGSVLFCQQSILPDATAVSKTLE